MGYQQHDDDEAAPLTHEQEVAAWQAQLEGRPAPGQRIVEVARRADPTPENIEFRPVDWHRFDGWTGMPPRS